MEHGRRLRPKRRAPRAGTPAKVLGVITALGLIDDGVELLIRQLDAS